MIKSIFAITKPRGKQTDRNRAIFSCWHLIHTKVLLLLLFAFDVAEHCYLWVNLILTEESFEKKV